MSLRRRVLTAGVFATLALGAAAPSAGAVDIATIGSAVQSNGTLTQKGRLLADSTPSDCGGNVLKLAPSIEGGTENTLYNYGGAGIGNGLDTPVCVTVQLTTACAGMNSVFSVAYTGTFNPQNPLANYAGDIGSPGPGTYSFVVEGREPVTAIVHERNVNQGCGGFTVKFTSDKPFASGPPTIGGDPPAVGNTISGTNASWASPPAPTTIDRQWLRCDAAGANCSAIPGQTGAQYTVTDADLGSTLRIRNVATDPGGSSTSTSAFVEPYIPFQVHSGQSLGAGDRVHGGLFARNDVESRCQVPTSTPNFGFDNYLFDAFSVRSLLNEPVCLIARGQPFCGGGITPAIYDPAFDPAAGLDENYAGNSGRSPLAASAVSDTLEPGGAREVVVSHGTNAGDCQNYTLTLGADAPFATARPTVSGGAAEGGTLTAADGTWSGTPAISRSWRRCDAGGANCAPIGGANGATYSPTAADVGSRLRVRVTATQGRTVSSDSDFSAVVTAAAQGGGSQPAVDRTAPKATLRLGSRDLAKAVKTGRVPVSVTCDEACAAVVEVRVTRKLAKALGLKKRVLLARAKGNLRAGRRTTLRAKLASRARRSLRSRRSLKVSLKATFADAAGNRAPKAAKGTLKRPRRR
jgi:hypothetical protein